jgi:hypothetical protein
MRSDANEVDGRAVQPYAKCPDTELEFLIPLEAPDWSVLVGQKAVVTTPICPNCGKEHAYRWDAVHLATA